MPYGASHTSILPAHRPAPSGDWREHTFVTSIFWSNFDIEPEYMRFSSSLPPVQGSIENVALAEVKKELQNI